MSNKTAEEMAEEFIKNERSMSGKNLKRCGFLAGYRAALAEAESREQELVDLAVAVYESRHGEDRNAVDLFRAILSKREQGKG